MKKKSTPPSSLPAPVVSAQSKPGADTLLALLLDSAKDFSIIFLDPTGHTLTWNPAAQALMGWSANEVIGQHFSKFYPREDIDKGKTEMELRVAEQEGRFEDEGWRVRKDGSRFWANVILTALRDRDGKLQGFGK